MHDGSLSSRGPRAVVGRYAIFDEIAAGGMASVHLGRRVDGAGPTEVVAIKRLHAQFAKDADFAQMFIDEARITAHIVHPNVIPTLDVAAVEKELLLVMEYVHGASLAALLRASRGAGIRVDPRVIASVVSDVLEGLHAAHEARGEDGTPLEVVHRDVSPDNVLVGVDGVGRVFDFGVAKAEGKAHSTRGGQLKGKLAYMSPEQVQSRPVTRRSDVFAVGAVLWEALAGARLFDGENAAELVMQVLSHPVAPPRGAGHGAEDGLDAVVVKALSRAPADRYATAREMADAIDKAILLASKREVARWVEATAGATLAARQELVAAIERAGNAPPHRADPRAVTLTAVDAPANAFAQTMAAPSNHASPAARPVGRVSRPEAAEPLSSNVEAERANPSPPISMRIPVPRREPAHASLWTKIEAPMKIVAAGAVLSVVDAIARPFLTDMPFRVLWAAEVLVVVGVVWALARVALPASRDGDD